MGLKREKKIIQPIRATFVLALALAVTLHAPLLRAEDTIDSVCGATLNHPQPSSSPAPGAAVDPNAGNYAQKLSYCQAAQSAQDGADADSALWKVWAAVGVVCTYGCIASFAGGPTSEYICVGATVAGGVTDAIATKNFAGALMAVAGAGAGIAINRAMNGSSTAAEEAANNGTKKDKDAGACLNAAMAGIQAFMKHKSMTDNVSTVQSNLASAKTVPVSAGPLLDTAAAGYQVGSGTGANGSGSGTGSGGNSGTTTKDSFAQGTGTAVNSACSGQSSGSSSAAAVMQCAVASDATLPGFVKSPKFPQEFQKDSGKSLSNFLAGNGPPGPMMASASGNGLSVSQSSKLASAIDEASQAIGATDYSNAVYAGGGGGSGSSSNGGEDEAAQMGAMMQGLMDKLNPNKKKEETSTGVSAVIFANKMRGPASVAEDRKLSIFDRVSYRYYFVGRQIVQGDGVNK